MSFRIYNLRSYFLYAFIFLIFFPQEIISQSSKVSFPQLLRKIQNDSSSYFLTEEINYLNTDPFQLPVVDEYEFRTDTDRWDFRRQRYTIRVNFSGWKERQYYRELQNQYIQSFSLENQRRLYDNITDAYYLFVDYYFGHRIKELREKEKLIIEDKLKVFDILAKSNNEINVNNLIRTEDDFYEVELDIEELKARNLKVQELFGIRMNDDNDFVIDTSNFISYSTMLLNYVETGSNLEKHPDIAFRKSQMEERLIEYDLEDAKTKRFLDYAQVRYAGRDNLNFGQEWSLGLGFRLPTKGSDKIRLKELELESIQDESDIILEKMEIKKEIAILEKKFSEIMRKIEIIENQIEKTRVRFTDENYKNLATKDPFALLRVEESQLSREIDIVELQHELYIIYVTVLGLQGNFLQSPVINYLSEGLAPF